MKIKLHHFLARSYSNGPGARAVIWVQGCPLRCAGCFNPGTHNFTDGNSIEVDELIRNVLSLRRHIQGVTISGGEPLSQPEALAELLTGLRSQSDLSVILLTGYDWNELQTILTPLPRDSATGTPLLLGCVDVLLAGRYDRQQHLASGLRGSANKSIHFLTSRYAATDFDAIPQAEIIVASDGGIIQSGIMPAKLQLENEVLKGGSYV